MGYFLKDKEPVTRQEEIDIRLRYVLPGRFNMQTSLCAGLGEAVQHEAYAQPAQQIAAAEPETPKERFAQDYVEYATRKSYEDETRDAVNAAYQGDSHEFKLAA